MAEPNTPQREAPAAPAPATAPDGLIKDLEIKVSDVELDALKGGKWKLTPPVTFR